MKKVGDDVVLKPHNEWTDDEKMASSLNSKALYALFDGVDPKDFQHTSKCSLVYSAWNIIQMAHEGNESVKESKLQMITREFELIRMEKDETIKSYHDKLGDLSNRAFAMGKKFFDKMMVLKMLRSLLDLFGVIVTTRE